MSQEAGSVFFSLNAIFRTFNDCGNLASPVTIWAWSCCYLIIHKALLLSWQWNVVYAARGANEESKYVAWQLKRKISDFAHVKVIRIVIQVCAISSHQSIGLQQSFQENSYPGSEYKVCYNSSIQVSLSLSLSLSLLNCVLFIQTLDETLARNAKSMLSHIADDISPK